MSNASEDLPEPDGPVMTVKAAARDLEVEALQVVLPRAADDDGVLHARKLSRRAHRRNGEDMPCVLSRSALLRPSTHETADDQHDERAEGRDADRARVQIAGGDASPAELRADQAAEHRADDAEDDREDAAGRVATGHEELRERSGDQAEQDPEEPERHG